MALCDVLSEQILPTIQEALQAQERAASKRKLLDAMPRKRSERIKVKVALQAQEEELRQEQIEMEREAEEKRAEERKEMVLFQPIRCKTCEGVLILSWNRKFNGKNTCEQNGEPDRSLWKVESACVRV